MDLVSKETRFQQGILIAQAAGSAKGALRPTIRPHVYLNSYGFLLPLPNADEVPQMPLDGSAGPRDGARTAGRPSWRLTGARSTITLSGEERAAQVPCRGWSLNIECGARMAIGRLLTQMYTVLRKEFGPQNWWPAQSPFEVVVGAVLTQNTNWSNVEKAIENLKRRGALDPAFLVGLEREELQSLIRPAGYYRQKAGRLRLLAEWIHQNCGGDLAALGARSSERLKRELISLRGIGPETADSILLYALNKPVFVVDTYTKRIAARHELIGWDCSYYELQQLFEEHLPRELELYKDFHAQLVRLGKLFCRPRPRCESCPVRALLGQPALEESS